MQDKYYGDKRDIVKWSGIVQLCRNHGIKNIVQVAFYKKTQGSPMELKFGKEQKPLSLPDEVVTHFRNIDDIRRLGDSLSMHIKVIREPFNHDNRGQYIGDVIEIIREIHEPKVVFLDPDTGLKLSDAKAEHVKGNEVKDIWDALNPKDYLILYQHSNRKKDWLETRKNEFAAACRVSHVDYWNAPDIAHDVVFFYIEKK